MTKRSAGQYRWIAVWICFGVGVHFFPLASTLDNRSLRLLGAPSTVTGAGAGLCLLAFGVATCLIGGRASADANELV